MYRNIAFSGGGAHTMAFIGAIKYMEENKLIENVRNIIGASGGSFFALLVVLNWSYESIHNYFTNDMVKHLEKNMLSVTSLIRLPFTFGLNDGQVIVGIVEDVLTKSGLDIGTTFMELTKMFGKNLVVAATNVTQKKIEYLSVDTEPEMKISTAIRMSTSIPILFTPVKYYNDLYVDSLIYNNFPVNFFKQFNVDTLGININYLEKKEYPKNFFSYMSTIYNCLYDSVRQAHSNSQNGECKICNIDIDESVKKFDMYHMKFVINTELITVLTEKGYTTLLMAFDKGQ